MTDVKRLEELVEMGGFLELTKPLSVFMSTNPSGEKVDAVVRKELKQGTLIRVEKLINKNTVALLEDINSQEHCIVKSTELAEAIK